MALSQEKCTRINSCMTTCPLNLYSSNFLALNYHLLLSKDFNFNMFFLIPILNGPLLPFKTIFQMKLHNLNYKSNFTPFFIIILLGKNKNS